MSLSAGAEAVSILHVDDDPEFGKVVKLFLEREDERTEVVAETSAADGLDCLKAGGIDCIVSDYDMPGMHGLEFLDAVRGPFPDIPFILFTGKGSEEIASEAISNGVTDYLQKGGTEAYEVLANRIHNSVDSFRTATELERSRQFLDRVLNLSPTAVVVLDADGSIVRANDLAETLLGLTEAEMVNPSLSSMDWQIVDADGTPVPDDDLAFTQVLETGEPVYNARHGIQRTDDETIWFSINAAPLWQNADTAKQVIAVLSDESSQVAREQDQEAVIRQLEGFGRVLSHDLGNSLTIAQSRLELARESGDTDHFEAVEESLLRAVEMLDELTTAIQAGHVVEEVTSVDVETVFNEAWQSQDTAQATKIVDTDIRICADETALLRLFENLIRNTLEHGTKTATSHVGALSNGFYVEDDGPGIPDSDRKQVFKPGHTTKEDGNGIGLPSIQQIALAHDWNVQITDGTHGGARFEFTNVERPAPA